MDFDTCYRQRRRSGRNSPAPGARNFLRFARPGLFVVVVLLLVVRLKHVRLFLLLARIALKMKTWCIKGRVHVTLHWSVRSTISLQHKHMGMYDAIHSHAASRSQSRCTPALQALRGPP